MNTKDKIAVMQAFANGEAIQLRTKLPTEKHEFVDWISGSNSLEPVWNWEVNEYRIKPKEPRKFFLILQKGTGKIVRCGYPPRLTTLQDDEEEIEALEILK